MPDDLLGGLEPPVEAKLGELLTFLDSDHLPPDNNLAERAARGVANDRGMGRGSRSETGAETYGDLKT